MELLELVRALDLADCWIGAGFVRDAIWAHLHERPPSKPEGDVDVIWFDSCNADEATDRKLEERLNASRSDIAWSVKNQARMHIRNGDNLYADTCDAMRFWPETATAIAARLTAGGIVEILAPLGLDDLLQMRLCPTERFEVEKRDIFVKRIEAKHWLQRYPQLTLTNPLGQGTIQP